MAPATSRSPVIAVGIFGAHGALVALVYALCLATGHYLLGCSSAPKKTPELASYVGKKVALVEVLGAEPTSRTVVEVALVNQLVKRGTFILVSRNQVEAARTAPDQDSTDWKGVAKRAGADLALRARILAFDAVEREGHDEQEVEDSQLAKERGESARKTKQVFKAKSLDAEVKVELEFTAVDGSDTRVAVAEEKESLRADARKSAIHFPPKMSLLEKLTNQAIAGFFEKYQ